MEEILYMIALPPPGMDQSREMTAKAEFGLARLVVASRIHELETGTPVSSVEELSGFFQETPVDPFTKEPYRYDKEGGVFYSVGPDDQDNSIDLSYDATNGTVSSGDSFFRKG